MNDTEKMDNITILKEKAIKREMFIDFIHLIIRKEFNDLDFFEKDKSEILKKSKDFSYYLVNIIFRGLNELDI